MTIGDYLVSISSLSTGTAFEHLQAIKTGTTFVQYTDVKLSDPILEAKSNEIMLAKINEDVFIANFIEN